MHLKLKSVLPEQVPLSLLLEADPSKDQIHKYLKNSMCYVAELSGQTVGGCVLNFLKDESIELFNISVLPGMQAQGIGTQLLRYVMGEMKKQGVKRIVLGTGTFGYQLIFYQRLGFRVESIDKDFFLRNYSEPVFENGIRLKDMLRLSVNLS